MEAVFDPGKATGEIDWIEEGARKACDLLADLVDMTKDRAGVCREADILEVGVSQWRAIGRRKGRLSNRPSPETAAAVLDAVCKRLPHRAVLVQRERLAVQLALLRLSHRTLFDDLYPLLKFDPDEWLGRLVGKVGRNIDLLPTRFRKPGEVKDGFDAYKAHGELELAEEKAEEARRAEAAKFLGADPVLDEDEITDFLNEVDSREDEE